MFSLLRKHTGICFSGQQYESVHSINCSASRLLFIQIAHTSIVQIKQICDRAIETQGPRRYLMKRSTNKYSKDWFIQQFHDYSDRVIDSISPITMCVILLVASYAGLRVLRSNLCQEQKVSTRQVFHLVKSSISFFSGSLWRSFERYR